MDVAPEFVIVGAPKCGTSALDQYLSSHPDIFMARKERHFFGSDLTFKFHRPTSAEYSELFFESPAAKLRGETSVWYLYSSRAAEEIHAHNPQARIIAMLRNPVDMIYSLHSQMLYAGAEDISDFRAALAAEADREKGERVPLGGALGWQLVYRKVGRYSGQLRRYFETFGRERVHTVMFDDLQQDARQTYHGVLGFLGLEGSFEPELRVVNANKRMRSQYLQTVVTMINQPPRPLRWLGRAVTPTGDTRERVQGRLATALTRANTVVKPRQPMDPDLRAELIRQYTPEIQNLAELLGKNLDGWLAPGPEDTGAAGPLVGDERR